MTDKEIIKNIEIQLADRGITVSCFFNELSRLRIVARSNGDQKMLRIISKFMSAIRVYVSNKTKLDSNTSWYLNYDYKHVDTKPLRQPMW